MTDITSVPQGNPQKRKLLTLMQIFQQETDSDHGLSITEIIEKLAEYDIPAERKSLYADIALLKAFGMDIVMPPMKPRQYRLMNRNFSTADLMLIIDSIQSSRFLDKEKADDLSNRLKSLASKYEVASLHRDINVLERPYKDNNESYHKINVIHKALNNKRKLGFRYFDYDTNLKRIPRYNEDTCVVSVKTLIYTDDLYYLIAYSDMRQEMRTYRVDRMASLKVREEPAERNELLANYDINKEFGCTFGMYQGERTAVTLRVDVSMMNIIVDRFGSKTDDMANPNNVSVKTLDDGAAAEVTVYAKISPPFYGWLAIMGNKAKILAPESAREGYLAYLDEIKSAY